MWRVLATVCTVLLGAAASRTLLTATTAQLPSHEALIEQYCVGCHSDRLKPGDLSLERTDLAAAGDDGETWERVVRQLRSGTMPPPGAPRPAPSAIQAFVSDLEGELDRAASAPPDPGRPPVHRLNRTEYTNAVRDLFALEFDAASVLPPDPSLGGFDNIAGVLSVSPVLLERYLTAAERVSRLVVGDSTIGPAFASMTYDVGKEVYQDARMGENLPFGSRGGLALRHHFPLDADYVWEIRLRRNIFGYVRGLREPQQIELRLDGEPIERFTVGGRELGVPAPESFGGLFLGDPAWEAYVLSADDGLEVRVPVKAGTRVVSVSFVSEPVEEEGVRQPPLTGLGLGFSEVRSSPDGPPGAAIDSISIRGPYNATGPGETLSRARVFACRPSSSSDEDSCAREIISTLAPRAYRRPVSDIEVDVLLDFFRTGQQEGGFDAGIRLAIERLLVDPNFLFRIERDPPGLATGAVYDLGAVELASRLSFFLWSSIPDDELLETAMSGQLPEPDVLETQVRRMLADGRATSLVQNFVGRWLTLQRLRDVRPDPVLFTDFDENLRDAFRRETDLFVESQLREDRSVVHLLDADYTFVNERLARHYGIPDVYGSRFRRVPLLDSRRVGVIGHGSVLTVTSYPNRTSPVQRGRWMLDNILGTPPPPPPPDTPTTLVDRDADGDPISARDQMERHRQNPACAGCHARMDPLGFALEHYDGIGRWREVDETGTAIDASGTFPDGAQFDGPAGLRRLLEARIDEYLRTFTEKLLTYALGRPLTYRDMPTVRAIVQQASEHDYRWSAFVRATVQSAPFRMRRTAS